MKWLSVSNLTIGDILQWSGTAWRNVSLPASSAASVVGSARGGTAVTISSTAFTVIPVDGTATLRGGAVIDNTGIAGNGIKPGVAGTYLIIAQLSTVVNDGAWIQPGYGINGAVSRASAHAGSTGQSGGTTSDVAVLGATDVVNLMGLAAVAAASYPSFCALHVIRLW